MSWIVTESGRLDVALVQVGAMETRADAQRAIAAGLVSVNSVPAAKAGLRVKPEDRLEIAEAETASVPSDIPPVALDVPVLYEDAACLVLLKPAGIPVHPGAGMPPGTTTLLHGIAHLFAERKLPFSPGSVLVHRLDQDTTGCLLVAKSPDAHRQLQQQFAERSVVKTYLALVAGVPSPPAAVIDAPVGRSTADRTTMAVLGAGRTREARTTYRTLAVAPDGVAALLSCDLHTGRTHQIRVHLSTVGHPVLGDDVYENPASERLAQARNISSLCLHAWRLQFTSPADGARCAAEAPVPAAFRAACAAVELSLEEQPGEGSIL